MSISTSLFPSFQIWRHPCPLATLIRTDAHLYDPFVPQGEYDRDWSFNRAGSIHCSNGFRSAKLRTASWQCFTHFLLSFFSEWKIDTVWDIYNSGFWTILSYTSGIRSTICNWQYRVWPAHHPPSNPRPCTQVRSYAWSYRNPPSNRSFPRRTGYLLKNVNLNSTVRDPGTGSSFHTFIRPVEWRECTLLKNNPKKGIYQFAVPSKWTAYHTCIVHTSEVRCMCMQDFLQCLFRNVGRVREFLANVYGRSIHEGLRWRRDDFPTRPFSTDENNYSGNHL